MELGKKIYQRRKELGISQQELANKTGLKNKASICKIESGDQKIPYDKLGEFAKALDVNIAYLLEDNAASVNETIGRIEEGLSAGRVVIMMELFSKLSPEKQETLINVARSML